MYMYLHALAGMGAQGPQHVVVAVKFGFAFLFISFLPWVKVHQGVYVYMYRDICS